jgi:hypothetical protein
MNEIVKFLMTWVLLLVWTGVLFGVFVYAAEEEGWRRNSSFSDLELLSFRARFLSGFGYRSPNGRTGVSAPSFGHHI